MRTSSDARHAKEPGPRALPVAGEMGFLIRHRDWKATSLASPDVWSQELKTLVNVMLASSQPAFIAWGKEQLFLYNDACAALLGTRHPDALGASIQMAWPNVATGHGDLLAHAFDGRAVTIDDVEVEMERPGRAPESHFRIACVPVRDEADGTAGVFCTCMDTTEQILARRREALAGFQGRLAEALRSLSDPVEVQSTASRLLGEYLGANRVVYFEIKGDEYLIERDSVYGVQPLAGRYAVSSFGEELLSNLLSGRTVVEFDATTECGRPEPAREAFAAIGVRGHVEVPLVKDGKFVAGMTVHVNAPRAWTEEEVALIEDTAERTWAAIERVRAEAALRLSEERSDFVRRSSGVGFWYCDLPFDVLEWDHLVKQHFFLPPDAIVTIETFYDRIHPDDREATRFAIEQSIVNRTHYVTVYRTVHPLTGEIKWVRAVGRTFYQEDGNPSRFDGVTFDVTEQKLAEMSLLEEDRRKDEFLATLAHELRNPLAPLRNGLQILRIGGGDPNVVSRAREMMERQVETMVRLVDDLLDVARISGGKIDLRRQSESLQTMVARAVETVMPLIEAHRHALEVNAPDQHILVSADSARFVQVLANLIGNAAKYTPQGGLIAVSVSTEGSEAVVYVTDNGVGIPNLELSRVFDMFSQVGETRYLAQGGLGIGLFLAKKLVDLHGGRLSAYSAGAGQGSTFTVRLPVMDTTRVVGVDPSSPTSSADSAKHLRILIVDDNLDAGDSLALRLSLDGHQTRVARDGVSGFRAAHEFQPQLAFLDIGMPGMNGYELAVALRNSSLHDGLVLVALTGWGAEADVERAKAAGFDRHLTKPASTEAIQSVLADVSKAHRA